MNNALKHNALLVSGLLGFIVPAYFGWTLYIDRVPQNVASWTMVLVLDALGLVLAYKGGNKRPFMQLGWTLAASCIFIALMLNGNPVKWGWVEMASVVLCGVAIFLWLTWDARVAQWSYMFAIYLSFTPQMVDYWVEPQPDTLWLWLWTIATCLLAVLGAEKRDFANTFIPWGAVVLNVIITVLCLL